MTRWLPVAALGVAFSLVVPELASAQSLAEVAAREKERRSGKKVKSYSEDDLGRSGVASSSETPSDESAAPAEGEAPEGAAAEGASGEAKPDAGAAKEKSQDDQRAAQEKAWQGKVQKARESLNNTAAEIESLQKDLANNTGNFYSASRTAMLNRMDELTKKYAADKDALDALREEGRKSQFRE